MGLQKYRADIAGEKQDNGAIPYYSKWMGGSTLALIRNCPTKFGPRTVYVRGEADTLSIPAACKYKGKTIKGYIYMKDGNYLFQNAYSQEPNETKHYG